MNSVIEKKFIGGSLINSFHFVEFVKSSVWGNKTNRKGIAILLKSSLSDASYYKVFGDEGGFYDCNSWDKYVKVVSVSDISEEEFVSRIGEMNLCFKEFVLNGIVMIGLSIIDMDKVKITLNGKRDGNTTYKEFMKNFALGENEFFKVSYDNGYSYMASYCAKFDYKEKLKEILGKDFNFRYRRGDIEIIADKDNFFRVDVWVGDNSEYHEVSNT